MTDSYGRDINYMRISVTDRCNLRCRYCMPESGVTPKSHSDIISLEEIAEIVRAAAQLGIRKIRITGGEPLVRRGITGLIKEIASIPGIDDLAMTTNGILLPENLQALRDAGLKRVNISLDTLNPQKYREITRLGELTHAINGIRAAADYGLSPIKINTVLIGGFNSDEIPALVELTRQYPVELRFIELMPMVSQAFSPEAFIPCGEVLAAVPELTPCGERENVRLFALPGAPGKVGLIEPVSNSFCGSCNRIRLTADGKIKPCLHSPDEISIRSLHGDELKDAIKAATLAKPACHAPLSYGYKSCSGRDMNRIGG